MGATRDYFGAIMAGVRETRQRRQTTSYSRGGQGPLGGYDATDGRGRRREVRSVIKHEDMIARERQRKILSANAQDLARNFGVARFAIGKHLDYVSRFCFKANTGDTGFDAELDRFMAGRTTRERFDAARRHTLTRGLRLTEAGRCVNGDIGWMQLAPGGAPLSVLDGKIQIIESDLIRTPPTLRGDLTWMNGVQVDDAGAALQYGLHTRTRSGLYEFSRIVNSARLFLHAWYDFRVDQVRGISPIASALNSFRDTYESIEFAYAKLKVSQLFGVQVTRSGETSTLPDTVPTRDSDGDGKPDSDYEVDLNSGPFMLDMNPGDEMKIVESATPSTEATDFIKLMIHVSLRSLDIPFSFFDESFTNFYGSRGALNQYLKSCKTKISDLQELLYWWTDWAMALAVFRGELVLPSGLDLSDIDYEWTPEGVPWWDSVKEVMGAKMAISGGLSSPQRECREADTDFKRNIDEIAEAMDYAEAARGGKGVPLDFGFNPQIYPLLAGGAADEAEKSAPPVPVGK